MSDSLRPHELQHARPPCPTATPRVHSNSCPNSCYPAISSSVLPFSSCPQSLPASGSFPMSQLCMREPRYWSFSFNISPSNEHSGLISFRMTGLISRLGRFPGVGNGNSLQYSCLENSMDRGTWWATVHGVAKSRTRLSNFTFSFHFHALEKEMATHSSVLAWRIPRTGSLVGCRLRGRTESDTTEVT